MAEYDIGSLFSDRRLNAGLGWAFVAFLVVVALEEVLVGDVLSAGFSLGVAAIATIPPLARRSAWVMLPWEVIGLASLPTVGRALATWGPAGDLATYLAVAAVALMIAVQLHAFTAVRMSYGFAALFVVVTTMAAAGVWAVVRWLADIQFGTGFIASEHALMWEFVFSTAAGVVAGLVFRAYFRGDAYAERLPDAELEVGGDP